MYTIGNGALLTPKEFAGIIGATRELMESSNAEQLLRMTLSQSITAALDSALFDATAASTTRPAGLMNGVTITAVTTGGTVDSMRKDIGNLIAAVAPVANGQIALVGSPDVAAKLLLSCSPALPYPVLSSGGLAAGFLVAVALPALVVVVDRAPRIEASRDALTQMEDTAPVAIGTAGSPNTVAAPVRSFWQSDSVSLRVILQISWGLRAPNAIAWTSGITW